VGKLFKPALVELEIAETIRAEAERTGANVALIRVDRDPRRGVFAIVAAADGADALREALGRYAFNSEVRAA
jgi:fatty-acyl-CoA synthase